MGRRKAGAMLCAAALSAFAWFSGGAGPGGGEAHAAIGPITVSLTETPEAFKNPVMGFRPSRYINESSFSDREYADIYKHYI
jgi:hypothetical protein